MSNTRKVAAYTGELQEISRPIKLPGSNQGITLQDLDSVIRQINQVIRVISNKLATPQIKGGAFTLKINDGEALSLYDSNEGVFFVDSSGKTSDNKTITKITGPAASLSTLSLNYEHAGQKGIALIADRTSENNTGLLLVLPEGTYIDGIGIRELEARVTTLEGGAVG